MAVFETVVRPVVLPGIRPAPARTLPPEDNPDEGKCIINGNGEVTFTDSENWSSTTSGHKANEEQRQFDVVRVRTKQDGNGSSRRAARAADDTGDDVYIDVEVLKKLWLEGSDLGKFTRKYAEVTLEENMEIIESNVIRKIDE